MTRYRNALPQLRGDLFDAGNPAELGNEYAALKGRLTELNVMGGCCGTDHRHVEAIAAACTPLFGRTA
jgi:methionine synthase I (cobalamin-dependent)